MALWQQADGEQRVRQECAIVTTAAVAQDEQIGAVTGVHVAVVGAERAARLIDHDV